MRKKFIVLSVCTLILALGIFIFTFYMFHYVTPEGSFGPIWYATAQKPFVTLLFGIWGVTFLFSSVMSLLIGFIFFNDK